MRAAAEFVGAVMLVLAMLGAIGVLGFEVRIGAPPDEARKTHMCMGAGQLNARAYPCTETEHRYLQQLQQQGER